MTKKLTAEQKQNRRPASRACTFCHTKHLKCNGARPCNNCIKRGVSAPCADIVRRRSKYLEQLGNSDTAASTPAAVQAPAGSIPATPAAADPRPALLPTAPQATHSLASTPGLLLPSLAVPSAAPTSTNTPQLFPHLGSMVPPVPTPRISLPKPAHDQQLLFGLVFLDQEYAKLTDLLLKTTLHLPGGESTEDLMPYVSNIDLTIMVPMSEPMVPPSGGMYSPGWPMQQGKRPFILLADLEAELDTSASSHPTPSLFIREGDSQPKAVLDMGSPLVFLANAHPGALLQPAQSTAPPPAPTPASSSPGQDPRTSTAPLPQHVLRKYIKTPLDLYQFRILPFDYPALYHLLLLYLKQRFLTNYRDRGQPETGRRMLVHIFKQMALYRPTFISTYRHLVMDDFIYQELLLQRALLEHELLLKLLALPTLYWRRTGELCGMLPEFSSMTGWLEANLYRTNGQRRFIYEMMDDELVLQLFESFKLVAVGLLRLEVKARCTLIRAPGFVMGSKRPKVHDGQGNTTLPGAAALDEDLALRRIVCQLVWTIKRDVFNLPMLLIGVFLPILPGTISDLKRTASTNRMPRWAV